MQDFYFTRQRRYFDELCRERSTIKVKVTRRREIDEETMISGGERSELLKTTTKRVDYVDSEHG